MADEARLHQLLDLVEQARKEGDKDTEAKATAAYKKESAPVDTTPKDASYDKLTPEQKRELETYYGADATAAKQAAAARPILEKAADYGKLAVGAGETGMQIATGLGSSAVAGLTAPFVSGNREDDAANYIRDFIEQNTYQPQTEMGQGLSTVAAAPFTALSKGAEAVATPLNKIPVIGPALAMTADTAIQGAPLLMGGRAGAAADLMKPGADLSGRGASIPRRPAPVREPVTLDAAAADVTPTNRLPGPAGGLPAARSTELAAANSALTKQPGAKKGPREPLKDARTPEPEAVIDEAEFIPPEGMKNATPDELRAADAKTLLDQGVRLTREQRGNGFVNKQAGSMGRAADAVLGKSKLYLEQLQDFSQAVLAKVGVKARNATPDAMRAIKNKSEAAYEAAHNGVHVKMDGQFIADLNDLRAEAHLNPYVEGRFDKMLDHILRNGNSGTMTAEAATKIRATLGKIEGGHDSNLTGIARDVKNALDEAAKRSATPEQAARMTAARKQFHFMKQIEGAVDPKGFISPKKLWNAINSKRNRNEAVYGKGDQALVNLARAGRNILPDAVGDSGSAIRLTDIGKIGAIISNPKLAAQTAGGVFGGRLLNEAGAKRGTPDYIAAQKAKAAQPPSAVPAQIARGAAVTETQEEKKRRLRAEALKGSN